MEQTKLFYRRWESKYSPHNRAVREAQSIAASDRTRTKRHERQALQRAALAAVQNDPATIARRAAAAELQASIAPLMATPRRIPIPSRACMA